MPVDSRRHRHHETVQTLRMSRRPSPLPDGLGNAFTCDDALERGVTPRRLRHDGLIAPTRGLRVIGDLDDLAARCAAYLLVLPQGRVVFSHTTAAGLLGLPVPADDRLHVTVPNDVQVRRKGVVVHHGAIGGRRDLDDIPVTSALRTWGDLSASLSVDDLVVLGDAILNHSPGLEHSLRQLAARRSRQRGARAARAAAALIRPGVLSPQESLWRLRFHRAGFPAPELNVIVRDRGGRWLGVGDFVWREQRLVVEYDGEYHFTVEQRRRDQARRRAMRDGDWSVIELNGADNRNPIPALRAVARALGRAAEM